MGKWDGDYHKRRKAPHKVVLHNLEVERLSLWQNSEKHRQVLSAKENLPFIVKVAATALVASIFVPFFIVFAILSAAIAIMLHRQVTNERKYRDKFIQGLKGNESSRLAQLIKEAERSSAEIKKIREQEAAAYQRHLIGNRTSGYDWAPVRDEVLARDENKCVMCSFPDGFERRSRTLHVHHITPLKEGGTNKVENLATLCNICHREEHRRLAKGGKPDDFWDLLSTHER